MKVYSVINMDIVGSSNVRDHNKLQTDLNSYIEHINKSMPIFPHALLQ